MTDYDVPFVAIGNGEMEGRPAAKAGDLIRCKGCGGAHELQDSKPPMLLFYKCGSVSYLGGIDGRLLAFVSPVQESPE